MATEIEDRGPRAKISKTASSSHGSALSGAMNRAKNSSRNAESAHNSRLSSPKYVKACKSTKPQAVVKVTSHVRGHRVKKLLQYVGRTDQENEGIELENETGSKLEGIDEVDSVYDEWKEDFSRAKPNAKRLSRHATHIVLSADADNTPENIKKVHAAARATAQELISDKGHDFVIGLHQDGNKPHVHLVVKADNREPGGPKFRIGPAQIQQMRENFAEKMSELGLEHVSTLRRDRPHEVESIKEGKAPLKSKTENHFSYSLDGDYKKSLHKSLVSLRQTVKDCEKPLNSSKTELLKEIRSCEKSLTKNPKDLNKNLSSMMKTFAKDAKQFKQELKQVTGPEPKKARTGNKKAAEIIKTKTERDIKSALDVTKNISDPKEKTKSLEALNKHSQQVTGKSIGRDTTMVMSKLESDLQKLQKRRISLEKAAVGVTNPKEKFLRRRDIQKIDMTMNTTVSNAKKEIKQSKQAEPMKKAAIKQINIIEKRTVKKSKSIER